MYPLPNHVKYHITCLYKLKCKCMPVMVVSLGSKLRHHPRMILSDPPTGCFNKSCQQTSITLHNGINFFSDMGKGLHRSIAVGTLLALRDCRSRGLVPLLLQVESVHSQLQHEPWESHRSGTSPKVILAWLEGFNKIIENV